MKIVITPVLEEKLVSTTIPLLRVLVVNDQREMCELWQRIIDMAPGLTCPGYALDGEDALQMVNQLHPDIVFMDVLMPGMTGDEAAKQIMEKYPKTVVILYSAYNNTEQRARSSGAADFVLMPIQPDKLIAMLRRAYSKQRNA
jgi:CheY-like chemotaxis protein